MHSSKSLLTLFLLLFATVAGLEPVSAQASTKQFGFVYVRVPRSQGPVDAVNRKGEPFTIDHPDVTDRLPDTQLQLTGFNAPGQLVHVDALGNRRILFDCLKEITPCVPLDPAVSFDGREILFSVLYQSPDVEAGGRKLGKTSHAQLMIARLDTGEIRKLPNIPGTFDLGPVWLPDGKIMFTSTRSGVWGTVLRGARPAQHHSLQLWIANADGTQPRNVGVHEVDGALNPFVLSSGRVIYSTWQLNHMLAFRANNGGPNKFGTLHNMFWVASVDQNGGDWQSLFGAHTSKYGRGRFGFSVKGLHFLGEMSSGQICATNYYRRNNLGGGQIVCWEPEPDMVEGMYINEADKLADIFRPRKMVNIAPWARSADTFSFKRKGLFLGKLRDPEGLPDEQLLLTFLRGACGRGMANPEKRAKALEAQPLGCDAGIYRTTRIPSESPADLEVLEDDPLWHEFAARVAEPYDFVHAMEKPRRATLRKTGDGSCVLGTASRISETRHINGYSFGNYRACGLQGCEIDGLPEGELKALRFWRVWPNTTRGKEHLNSLIGNQTALLGDVPLEEDGSAIVQIPCDMPYLMAGVDGDGLVIKRDQVVQSLRPGEKRVCSGCHLHSRPGPSFPESVAAQRTEVPALGTGVVPYMHNGELQRRVSEAIPFEYHRDIQPIFVAHCLGCHSGEESAAGLRLDLPGVGQASTYFRLVWDYRQKYATKKVKTKRGTALQRPNTSKYINAAFARESLLYWKTANRRTDGRSDSTYPNDIDFGPDHPTTISPEELRILGSWIDSGAYAATPGR